jgi:RHS repeat-associated protein
MRVTSGGALLGSASHPCFSLLASLPFEMRQCGPHLINVSAYEAIGGNRLLLDQSFATYTITGGGCPAEALFTFDGDPPGAVISTQYKDLLGASFDAELGNLPVVVSAPYAASSPPNVGAIWQAADGTPTLPRATLLFDSGQSFVVLRACEYLASPAGPAQMWLHAYDADNHEVATDGPVATTDTCKNSGILHVTAKAKVIVMATITASPGDEGKPVAIDDVDYSDRYASGPPDVTIVPLAGPATVNPGRASAYHVRLRGINASSARAHFTLAQAGVPKEVSPTLNPRTTDMSSVELALVASPHAQLGPSGSLTLTAQPVSPDDGMSARTLSVPLEVRAPSALAPLLPTESMDGYASGATPGAFSVSPDGSATFHLPLWTPPGRNGMQPALALDYNSNAGDGMLGMGWRLSGLSQITRCKTTFADDTVAGPVTFDASGAFCLDGERLALAQGANGADGAIYYTRHDTFARLTVDGTDVFGPTAFEERTRDERILLFTPTRSTVNRDAVAVTGPRPQDAHLSSAGSVRYSWELTRIMDRFGNTIDIDYTTMDTPGQEPLPALIRYTGSTKNTALAPQRMVKFDYAARPYAYSPSQTHLISGVEVDSGFVLTNIEMWGPNGAAPSMARDYALLYNEDFGKESVTRRPLLISVADCDSWPTALQVPGWGAHTFPTGPLGAQPGVCKRPLTFDYQAGSTDFQDIPLDMGMDSVAPLPAVDTLPSTGSGRLLVADINGDGRDDLLFIPPQSTAKGAQVSFALASSTSSATPFGPTTTVDLCGIKDIRQLYAADMNLDGYLDLLAEPSDGNSWVTLHGAPDGFPAAPTASDCQQSVGYVPAPPADLNGDGRPDLVFAPPKQYHAYCEANLPTGFSSPYMLPGYAGPSLFIADLDGRGDMGLLAEWLIQGYSNNNRFSYVHLDCAPAPGHAPASIVVTNLAIKEDPSNPSVDNQYIFSDVNGDGAVDAMHFDPDPSGPNNSTLFFQWNTGNGFLPEQTLHLNYDRPVVRPIDLFGRGDGTHELLLRDTHNDGAPLDLLDPLAGFKETSLPIASRVFNAPATNLFEVLDVNGDGLDDFVMMQSAKTGEKTSADQLHLFLHKGKKPDLLVGVHDSLGATTTVCYEPLTHQPTDYDYDPGAHIEDCPSPSGDTRQPVDYPAVYKTTQAANYPLSANPRARWVVAAVTQSNGSGGAVTERYTYEDARTDLTGQGFLGFLATEVTNPQAGVTTRTVYDPSPNQAGVYPLIGQPTSVTTTTDLGGGAERVHKVDTAYAIRTGSTPESVFTFPQKITDTVTDYTNHFLVSSPIQALTTTQDMDAYGNLTLRDQVYADGTRDTYSATFLPDSLNWLIDLVDEETESSTPAGGATVTRQTAYEYGEGEVLADVLVNPGAKTSGGYERLKAAADGTQTLIVSYQWTPEGLVKTITEDGGPEQNPVQTQDAAPQPAVSARRAPTSPCSGPPYCPGLPTFGVTLTPNHGSGLDFIVKTCPYKSAKIGFDELRVYADGKTLDYTDYRDSTKACGSWTVSLPETHVGEHIIIVDALLNRGLVGEGLATYRVGALPVKELVRTHTFTYDDAEHMFPVSESDKMFHQTATTYQAALGLPVSATDVNGVTTYSQYDGFGRLRHVAPPDGNDLQITYSASCETLGFAIPVSSCTQEEDAAGAQTDISYDILGRLILTETRNRADLKTVAQRTVYDGLGRVSQVSLPFFTTDTPVYTTSTYDALNRTVSEQQPDGSRVTYAYLGTTTTQTDANQHTHVVERDQLGRVIAATDVDTTDVANQRAITTRYSYGAFDTLVGITDAAGNSTRRSYDREARVIDETDPDSGHATLSYNAFGDVVRTTAGKQVTTYEYDDAGRLDRMHSPDGWTGYVWDVAENGVGKLALMATGKDSPPNDEESLIDYRYDGIGRQRSQSWELDNEAFSMRSYFDGVGRQVGLDYPQAGASGSILQVLYRYGALGELQQIVDTATSVAFWTRLTSDASGVFTDARLGMTASADGVTVDQTEDRARPGHLGSIQASDAQGHQLLGLEYDYDAKGNVDRRIDHVQGTNASFTYDALDRLIKESDTRIDGSMTQTLPRTTTWTYDDTGNLCSRAVAEDPAANMTYSYPHPSAAAIPAVLCSAPSVGGATTGVAGPHALVQSSAGQYQYDDRGNQTSAPGDGPNAPARTIQYTASNLPASITRGALTETMRYDGAGDRVLTTDSSGNEVISLGGLYERRLENKQRSHVFYIPTPDGSAAQVVWNEDASGAIATQQTFYLIPDALGSVALVVDGNGQVVLRETYAAFGARTGSALTSSSSPPTSPPTSPSTSPSTSPPASVPASPSVRLGFGEHLQEDDLGLIDMGARWYDPSTGRFLSPDPMRAIGTNGQRLNPYSYVLNNPLTLQDPTGMDDEEEGGNQGQICIWIFCFGGVSSSGANASTSGPGFWNAGSANGSSSSGASSGYRPTITAPTSPPLPPSPPPPTNGAAANDDGSGGTGVSAVLGSSGKSSGTFSGLIASTSNWLGDAAHWFSKQEKFANAVAGFGDTLSGGLTAWIRGEDGIVDQSSGYYIAGSAAGTVWGAAITEGLGIGGAAPTQLEEAWRGWSTARGMDQHHIFPQVFRAVFEDLGINIDLYTISIPKTLHERMHDEWNYAWSDYISQRGDKLTPEDAAQFARWMLDRWDLSHLEYEVWKYSKFK